MRIATYNTFEGGRAQLGPIRGRDRLLLDVVKGINPDLIAMQELVDWQDHGRVRVESFGNAARVAGEI